MSCKVLCKNCNTLAVFDKQAGPYGNYVCKCGIVEDSIVLCDRDGCMQPYTKRFLVGMAPLRFCDLHAEDMVIKR